MTRTARTLLLFLPVAAAALLLTFTMTCDSDTLWHVKSGLVMLERGSLLRTNTFAATYPDHPWPNPEWLFQVLLALLHRGGGFVAIGGLKVLAAVALAGALYALMVRRAGHPGTAAALVALVLGAIQFRLTERPQLFSFLFFLVTLLVVERARAGPSRLPWVLPALFALWSNIHPEFVMGFLALGAALVGDALDRRLAPAGPDSRQARLLLPALLCLPAACVNPEGYHALLFPLLHTFIGPIVAVTEYAPTGALRVPAFWPMVALTAATLFRFRRASAWGDVLLAGGMALLGALYLRATPYFFLVAAPLLHRHATAAAAAGSRLTAQRLGAVALVAAAASLSWALGFERLLPYRWGLGLDDAAFPTAAAAAVERHGLPGRLYNLYGDGGYLIYRLYPGVGVFQDGRLQAYPREFMARLNARFDERDWPAIVEEYRVNTLLLPLFAAARLAPLDAWGMVFWDDSFCVLVRRTPQNAALLARLEYRLFRPGLEFPAGADPRGLVALGREMERNQSERRRPSLLVARELEEVRAKISRADAAPAAAPGARP
jgi:hypothetical protein